MSEVKKSTIIERVKIFCRKKGCRVALEQDYPFKIVYCDDYIEYTLFENPYGILHLKKHSVEIVYDVIYVVPLPEKSKDFNDLLMIIDGDVS